MHKQNIITIDGPSGSGKGSVAIKLSQALNFKYLDSGSIYRALAYSIQKEKKSLKNKNIIAQIASSMNFDIKLIDSKIHIMLNNENINDFIRTEEIAKIASELAKEVSIRKNLLVLQQNFYSPSTGLIAEGRDMGSVVFKEAKLKIYLTASAEIRAKRRYEQLAKKQPLETIIEDMKQRDLQDSQRKNSPLIKLNESIEIDNSNMNLDEVVEKILFFFKKHKNQL